MPPTSAYARRNFRPRLSQDVERDTNPRPHKRQRMLSSSPDPLLDSDLDSDPLTSLPPSSAPASPSPAPKLEGLKSLPTPILLVSLPAMLSHPPNHKYYIHSLVLSLTALRKCLALPALSPDIECRAWTGLAEIGMRVISGGMSQSEDHPWAKGIETEVEKALSKGSIIAQKHPSLRAYSHQLSLLQAQLSQWQQKIKFARNQIRNLISSLQPTDPPHIVYSAHLALISHLTAPVPTALSPHSASSSFNRHPSTSATHARGASSPQPSAQDIYAALDTIKSLEDRANVNKHKQVALLTRVIRARTLVAANLWTDVHEVLLAAEHALGLSYEPATTPKPRKPLQPTQQTNTEPSQAGTGTESQTQLTERPATFISFEDPFEAAMVVHLLMLAVVYYTHVGEAAEVSPRLSHLHALLDSDVLEKFPQGCVEVPLSHGPSLVVQVTHPRILFLLAFLISSVSKRDAVGRKPKRKVFAAEGLATWETEAVREILFSPWSSAGDVQEVEERLTRIKADLLCEVVAVSIMRSEFDVAEENLNVLIAHARTYGIFPLFSARIALHHAHLAQALLRPARALRCYRAAMHHTHSSDFVHVAARAGEVALRVGVLRRRALMGEAWREGLSEVDEEWPFGDDDQEEVELAGTEVVKICRKMGGTMEAIAHILEACLSPEILKSKQHLKRALELATQSLDNHLRALVLALISAHYLHTSGDHARTMLQTCEQLAAGLGAPAIKAAPVPANGKAQAQGSPGPVVVGNAPLGLWVGERFLELYNRFGKESRAQRQVVVNTHLVKAMDELTRRGHIHPPAVSS